MVPVCQDVGKEHLAPKLIIFQSTFHNEGRLHDELQRYGIILGTVVCHRSKLFVMDHGNGITVCQMSFQSRMAAGGNLLMCPPLCDMEVPSPHSHPLCHSPSPEAHILFSSTLFLSFILSAVLFYPFSLVHPAPFPGWLTFSFSTILCIFFLMFSGCILCTLFRLLRCFSPIHIGIEEWVWGFFFRFFSPPSSIFPKHCWPVLNHKTTLTTQEILLPLFSCCAPLVYAISHSTKTCHFLLTFHVIMVELCHIYCPWGQR